MQEMHTFFHYQPARSSVLSETASEFGCALQVIGFPLGEKMRTKISPVLAVLSVLFLQGTIQEELECGETEFVCGMRQVEHPRHGYYQDYEGPAYPGEWPWYSAVYIRTNKRTMQFKCGASLISRKHLITTRLCVTDEFGSALDVDRFLIQMGTHKLNVFNFGFARFRKVQKIHQPADYNETSENHIVILEMNAKVRFNKYVQPICIYSESLEYGMLYSFIGWEVVEQKPNLGTIIKRSDVCTDKLFYYYSFCGDNGRPFCEKDHGSLSQSYSYDDEVWYILGIINCEDPASKWMDAYKSVFKYKYFIINVTQLEYLQKIREGQHFDPSIEYPNLLPQQNCGHTFIENNKTNEFPWIAYVMAYVGKLQWQLEAIGSLISYRYVLTSAIEVDIEWHSLKIRLGDNNPDCNFEGKASCTLPIYFYDVEYTIVHPDYQSYRYGAFENNIALLRTSKVIHYDDHIYPVCLPVSQELRKMKPAEYVTINLEMEFGGDNKYIPEKITVSALNKPECIDNEYPQHIYTSSQFQWTTYIERTRLNNHLFGYVSSQGYENRLVLFAMPFFSYASLSKDSNCNVTVSMNISHHMDWIAANLHE